MTDNKKQTPVKEKKLNESQFRNLVRQMVRKSIKEHVAALNKADTTKKPPAASPKKLTMKEFRDMVRNTIRETLEKKRSRPKK